MSNEERSLSPGSKAEDLTEILRIYIKMGKMVDG